MKLNRTLAVARKEWIHILRDWRSLILAISIPLNLLILFGFALTFDVDHVPMVIWDQDRTPTSREFISRFQGSRYFDIKTFVDNYRDIEWEIDHGQVNIALVIPNDFTKKIKRREEAHVQVIVDGSDSNTATLSLGYTDTVVSRFSNNLRVDRMAIPINFAGRVWYNEELKSQNNIVPGLIAVIMMVVTAMLTSLTISREWEKGTMELLISTPVKVPELLIGKMIPYFLIGIVDVILIMLMGEFFFQVPFRGSLLLLMTVAMIFLVGALSLGTLISITAKNQLLASQMAMVSTFLPSFLLSGFFNKISNMPIFIQYLTYLVPARYFIELLRGIYLKGVGIKVLYVEVVLLTLFSTAMLWLAHRKFKKKLT